MQPGRRTASSLPVHRSTRAARSFVHKRDATLCHTRDHQAAVTRMSGRRKAVCAVGAEEILDPFNCRLDLRAGRVRAGALDRLAQYHCEIVTLRISYLLRLWIPVIFLLEQIGRASCRERV